MDSNDHQDDLEIHSNLESPSLIILTNNKVSNEVIKENNYNKSF